jgi:hypothetical protein
VLEFSLIGFDGTAKRQIFDLEALFLEVFHGGRVVPLLIGAGPEADGRAGWMSEK